MSGIIDGAMSNNFTGDNAAKAARYTGHGDFSVDTPILDEETKHQHFSVEIINTLGENKTIVINPGYFSSVEQIVKAGFNADAIMTDGDLLVDGVDDTKKLNFTSPDMDIADFLDFVKHHPTRIVDFSAEVNDPTVYPSYLHEFPMVNPFARSQENKIPVSKYYTQDSSQANKVFAPEELQLDPGTLLFFTMPGTKGDGTALTKIKFTFNIGSIKHPGLELRRKGYWAYRNSSQKQGK